MVLDRGLVFSFKELLMECEVIKTFAHRFLDSTTVAILDEAKGNLQTIQARGSTTDTTPWSIPEVRALRTVWSEGDSKPERKASHHIRGEFSFVWQIRPLDEKPFRSRSHLVLDGLASSTVSFVDKGKSCISQWTVDVGDHQSPGMHFHSQVKRFGSAPYPASLDVPRFPAYPMSPFLVLEFAIGELFQDKWKRHAVADSADAKRWRSIHEPRLRRFFQWQINRLEKTPVGSPWMALKLAKPDAGLLVEAG